ncbi:hypothetical protein BBBOND_0401460 [Babesia bigemina]|uniref:Uncharacterized protein n=1 Tax=Babesia bigemina TaxID=5866 RepID=A0A061DDS5_BABBI|nr:hypothetical protein BBBOND_0401460 [Babesia bigemina]CDR97654.1 hypothetical protein BBBOND_0401460 [Babesia bigemina]|eukprot:XP_012769840.1 hypothetical protein BBBOND_0401460 [Babesia bigemina]
MGTILRQKIVAGIPAYATDLASQNSWGHIAMHNLWNNCLQLFICIFLAVTGAMRDTSLPAHTVCDMAFPLSVYYKRLQ